MKHIRLYTDGACAGNPGRGGWAAIAFDEENNSIMAHSGGYRHTTNNRMEIMAVIKGLNAICNQLREYTRDTDIKVTVCSDSQLVVNTINEGWNKKTNKDLWDQLDNALCFWGAEYEIKFKKVKGHSNDTFNKIADEYAVEASKEENAIDIDSIYENINTFQKTETKDVLGEPEVTEIRLKNVNIKELRMIEVDLSNGTTVKISGMYREHEFQQYDCNLYEAYLTIDIARKFSHWLNGKKL